MATKRYPRGILDLMAEKTAVLTKAQALTAMDMPETARPLWLSAASCEERLAPLLEALGHTREAAVHRISAASCYRTAGELNRAVNLYQAALAGPLRKDSQRQVRAILASCLTSMANSTRAPRRSAGRAPTGV